MGIGPGGIYFCVVLSVFFLFSLIVLLPLLGEKRRVEGEGGGWGEGSFRVQFFPQGWELTRPQFGGDIYSIQFLTQISKIKKAKTVFSSKLKKLYFAI